MFSGTFVDLGLSVKWFSSADSSIDYFSYYFSWGAIDALDTYTWEEYKFGNINELTKYTNIDGLTRLELEDDAFYYEREDGRIPSLDLWKELLANCTFLSYQDNINTVQENHYLTIGGQYDVFTDRPDDSETLTFFDVPYSNRQGKLGLPSERGFYVNKEILFERFSFYWTSTVCSTNKNCAYAVQFLNNNKYRIVAMPRCLGLLVTAVNSLN